MIANQNAVRGASGDSTPRAGRAALILLFWSLGAALLAAPFFGSPQRATPEGEDPGRLESEIDIPFDEDVAAFQEDFEIDVGAAIRAASETWFGEESDHLRASGVIKLERLEAGRIAYGRYCVGCHSTSGDGGGAAARYLNPRPRNFRRGIFKFTSTSSGAPPTRKDLFQTITRGLSGSSMPDFRLLSEERRWDLVEYVRYLSIRGAFEQLMIDLAWDEEEVPDDAEIAEIIVSRWTDQRAVFPPIPEPRKSEEGIERGRQLYLDSEGANCVACHGATGIGDGPSATDFQDDWGYPLAPRDLTRGVFRAGAEPADLYRSIQTGINGTPMPSFTSTAPEDIWAMVHFVQSLRDGNE